MSELPLSEEVKSLIHELDEKAHHADQLGQTEYAGIMWHAAQVLRDFQNARQPKEKL